MNTPEQDLAELEAILKTGNVSQRTAVVIREWVARYTKTVRQNSLLDIADAWSRHSDESADKFRTVSDTLARSTVPCLRHSLWAATGFNHGKLLSDALINAAYEIIIGQDETKKQKLIAASQEWATRR